MKKAKALLKTVLGRMLRIVLWVLFSVVFFMLASAVLSVLFFFLFYLLGAFPMDFVGSEGGRVFFHVLIMLVYFVAFVLEGGIIGFYVGVYIQIKNTLQRLKLFQRIYKKVMEKLYDMMKKKGYIATQDFDKHKGKERVEYKHTLNHMNTLIDEVIADESGGALGLFSSPLKWTSYRFGSVFMKKVGKFVLQRMSKKDKTGDSVIFLSVLDWAVQKGMWGFIKRYLLNPLLAFTLVSFGIFIVVILIPMGLCWLFSAIF